MKFLNTNLRRMKHFVWITSSKPRFGTQGLSGTHKSLRLPGLHIIYGYDGDTGDNVVILFKIYGMKTSTLCRHCRNEAKLKYCEVIVAAPALLCSKLIRM